MEIFSLFQDLDLTFHQWKKGTNEMHKHTFFEIIYITKGQGIHEINNKKYQFKKGDFFLLIPGDEHAISVKEQTDFFALIFNKTYFNKENLNQEKITNSSMIFKHLELFILNSKYIKQPIFTDSLERTHIELLITNIINEFKNRNLFFETIIQNSIIQILCLIARKIRTEAASALLANGANAKINEILFYIQDNIYDNEKIKVSNLALKFNKSRNHFGNYFKQNTGYSTKEYILNYKFNLIKNKLSYTNHSIGEIAYTLGFTDENHLNKFLKLRLGMTASAFRKGNI
ncbi:AraC family transcriptional regulator [Flavobacterium sp. HJSW_4]|uniref:AraC family transcriptional regulator n=1 Tax=Flavobacterium sp. HJSW_4 TaxID=3344660 RepID=UPI0035F27D49